MLNFIIVLYSVVAIIGVYLLIKVLSKNSPKLITGIIHGMLGLFGISFLIIFTSFQKGDSPVVTIILFVIAFFIGGGMFVMNAQEKKYPVVIALIHAAIALTGLYFLLRFSAVF